MNTPKGDNTQYKMSGLSRSALLRRVTTPLIGKISIKIKIK